MTSIEPDMLEGVGRLAFVGVAKNCGKTTTLNYLLSSGACDARTVGLVSIGIDGESADLLIGTKKPSIRVAPGQWVVTARDALQKSSARIEFVDTLGFSTPLGEVIVGRVMEAGAIILAGLRHREDLEQAAETLERHGVDLVLIDGAYGRTVAARAGVSDAIILSTGAVLADDVQTIVARTAELVDRLVLEPAEAGWQRELLERAIGQDRCLLGGPNIEPVELAAKSALLGLRGASQLFDDSVGAIAIPGLVSDSVVEHLLGVAGGERTLLVPDGTVLQASGRLLGRLERRWQICALDPAQLLAISVNPMGVQGHQVDPDELCDALQRRWPDWAVFNPLHSAGSPA